MSRFRTFITRALAVILAPGVLLVLTVAYFVGVVREAYARAARNARLAAAQARGELEISGAVKNETEAENAR